MKSTFDFEGLLCGLKICFSAQFELHFIYYIYIILNNRLDKYALFSNIIKIRLDVIFDNTWM